MIRNSIEVWILVDTRILLLRVLQDEGDFWQPITGGIEAGESPRQAAVREIFEETGLNLEASALKQVVQNHVVPIDDDLSINKTLFFARSAPWPVVLSPSEHYDWKTVELDDVDPELRWNKDTWAMIRPLAEARY